jgi:hypothetical protein
LGDLGQTEAADHIRDTIRRLQRTLQEPHDEE